MLWIAFFSLAAAAALGAWAWSRGDLRKSSMAGLIRLVRTRFPGVRQLSTAELAAWQADPQRVQPALLDVRRRAEFDVSRLPGARHVEPDTDAAALAPTLPADRPVVVYCSVGYRSSDLASRLIAAGYTNVFNLEGSIFTWAAEDRPLEAEGGTVRLVHPYHPRYRHLLPPGRAAGE